MPEIKNVLISVFDKTGVVDFARGLSELGVGIISTGGTSALLSKENIDHRQVYEITKFPEVLQGRVKTLHPNIFMGLLAKRNQKSHLETLEEYELSGIDMVVVNLYPFADTVSDPDVSTENALEQIDIGGVALLRAAAKNYPDVVSLVTTDKYEQILKMLRENNTTVSEQYSLKLASEVFTLVSSYDWHIGRYLSGLIDNNEGFPEQIYCSFEKIQELRYGENPHQRAAIYHRSEENLPYEQLSGKELSFNNLIDVDAAITVSQEYEKPTVAIIKHANPCGVGTDAEPAKAFDKALQTDKVSAFGGIIGLNKSLDVATAEKISEMFVEVVVAPDFDPGVLETMTKKKNLRVLKFNDSRSQNSKLIEIKTILGGVLMQDKDVITADPENFKVVTSKKPTELEFEALLFGWKLIKYVKSNAVIFCSRDRTLGIGAGQPSRVDATELAIFKAKKANLQLTGSVVVSDAFFPFRDGIDVAHEAGATAVIQPGGSIRDEEVIAAADEHNMSMVFTGIRHFRH